MGSGMLKGKKALITGGDRGLGYEIAAEFLRQGADICICSRNADAIKEAAVSLGHERQDKEQRILYKKADVSVTKDLDELYKYIFEEFSGDFDTVVNNAGIQGPIGSFEDNEWQEILNVINVNLLGTMYSMKCAIGMFKSMHADGTPVRDRSIINISGGGATGARPYFTGYAVAKTGVVRATETLAKENEDYGIRINAIAPGAMNTRMLEDILNAGENAGDEYRRSLRQKENGGASMENAAGLVAYLASEKAAGVTGRLISAVWDDWKELDKHAGDLNGSDLYTLRRIIPRDRGLDWE
ncbi:MAG: SDR family oxidoreductase [Lachnospiraceae bacterium]|nr:SDR family oxidoreductase [Lachnospiraceae bacterium]